MASESQRLSNLLLGAFNYVPGPTTERRKRRKRHRKLWLNVHLYLGLIAGGILTIIGVTGSILAYWLEIDRWLNPQLMIVPPPSAEQHPRPMQEIVAAATAAMPPNARFSFAYPPHFPEMAYFFFYNVPATKEGKYHSVNVCVDPYTAQVLGTRVYSSADSLLQHSFTGFILVLHYSLFAGAYGETVVGILGLFLITSLLTGLLLWWPPIGKGTSALTFKRGASAQRLNYDLHKIFGVSSFFFLVVVFVSGISMNLPDQSGLISVSLFVTGFIRWRQKRRISKFHEERLMQLSQLPKTT